MLVFIQVSSMKTGLRGSALPCRRFHRSRRRGRACRRRASVSCGRCSRISESPNRGDASLAKVIAGQALTLFGTRARVPSSFGLRRLPIRLGRIDPCPSIAETVR